MVATLQMLLKGHKVTILDKETSLAKKDQKMIIGNMMDQDILNSSMEDIDYIYYFAGIADIEEAKSDPYETIELNIMGLTKALGAAVKIILKNLFMHQQCMFIVQLDFL